jgi:hypothetical protein
LIGARRHAGSGSFAKPPFIAKTHRRRTSRGWWSGLTGGGKLAVYAVTLLIITFSAVLAISAGGGNGTPLKPSGIAYVADSGLAAIAESVMDNLGTLRQSIFSHRLQIILNRLSSSAPELQRRLTQLSKVVQGDRCQGYLAEVAQLSDASLPRSVPRDPEGIWRYANKLADFYIPVFKGYLTEVERIQPQLPAIGLPAPLSEWNDLLLKSCDLQLKAMRQCIQGLKKLRDCNEMTVGQASELVGDGVAKVREASACLSRVYVALSKKD